MKPVSHARYVHVFRTKTHTSRKRDGDVCAVDIRVCQPQHTSPYSSESKKTNRQHFFLRTSKVPSHCQGQRPVPLQYSPAAKGGNFPCVNFNKERIPRKDVPRGYKSEISQLGK